jgi:Xaa-Pro aminopeptidase
LSFVKNCIVENVLRVIVLVDMCSLLRFYSAKVIFFCGLALLFSRIFLYIKLKDVFLQSRNNNKQLLTMTKAEQITSRVDALRSWMRQHNLSAFIFPSTDPHTSEYVPDHWKTREWISGFNGSAGTAVVTLTRAALWTDSRYWLAADEQTAGTPFEVMRCSRNVATTDELIEWISKERQAPAGDDEEAPMVGIDGWCVAQSYAVGLQGAVDAAGMTLCTDRDPAAVLWTDRPSLPASPIELQPLEYAGETAESKLQRIRETVGEAGANATIVTQLDDIAWTLNMRGTDVHCTPVFVAYLMILPDSATLYVDAAKLSPEVRRYLDGINVQTAPYQTIADDLSRSRGLRGLCFLIDPDTTNSAIYNYLAMADTLDSRSVFPDDFYANAMNIAISNAAPITVPIVEAECPVAQMKTLKNTAEIRGMHSAMLKDGVAMVKCLRALSQIIRQGQDLDSLDITEMGVDKMLTAFRAEQEGFRDISFDTIAGYGHHAAIVHYEASPETDIPLKPHGLLLLDSGAQYVDGTTDITRTIALGPLTYEERRDYTLVLKGHIRLATAVFPKGTSGTQLDVLARYAMWQDHKNYGHGTGHGVGSFLSVHEGPHQFRMNWMPAPLRAGMTITIEPGIYIAGSHGVRIENTMLIVEDDSPVNQSPIDEKANVQSGAWLRMEPLTLCPVDTKPIVMEMMAPDEVAYLNNYHARVREALLPLLTDEDDRHWLIKATEAI